MLAHRIITLILFSSIRETHSPHFLLHTNLHIQTSDSQLVYYFACHRKYNVSFLLVIKNHASYHFFGQSGIFLFFLPIRNQFPTHIFFCSITFKYFCWFYLFNWYWKYIISLCLQHFSLVIELTLFPLYITNNACPSIPSSLGKLREAVKIYCLSHKLSSQLFCNFLIAPDNMGVVSL